MAVETVTLPDLGPIIAAILGPMLAFVAVSMRYQHNDSTKTRDLTRELISESSRENRQLIERASRENRELIERATDKLSAELADHRQLSEQRHQEVARSLGEARERLARIEGHLRIGTPPPHENETGEESGKAA
jgi:hypothetical protein